MKLKKGDAVASIARLESQKGKGENNQPLILFCEDKNVAKTVDAKFRTVIEKNTFYFFNRRFEEKYEGYLTSL